MGEVFGDRPMSTFNHAIMICGLSVREAADYLKEPVATVAAWCSGVKEPSEDAWMRIADLHSRIDFASATDEAVAGTSIRDLLDAPRGATEAAHALARMGAAL